jgi:hypothetical protein
MRRAGMVAVSEPARTLPPRAADCGGCLGRAIDAEICDATTGEGIEIESTPLPLAAEEGCELCGERKGREGKGIAGGMRCFYTFFILSPGSPLVWLHLWVTMALWKVLVNVVG